MKQLLAEYTNYFNPVEAQQLLKAALVDNRGVLRPIEGIAYTKLMTSGVNQAKQCSEYLVMRFGDGNKIVLAMNAVLEDLDFIPNTAPRFEEALKELAFLIGFKGPRPENEVGKGPDDLWEIGSQKYFVVEAKNGATTDTICKDYCNQLGGSMNWFSGMYDGTCEATPIMVHPSKVFEYASSPHPKTRIIDAAKLSELREACRKLAQADIIGDLDFRNRILSPTLGRWLSNDPLGYVAGDVNMYRYVSNGPNNGSDPTGLEEFDQKSVLIDIIKGGTPKPKPGGTGNTGGTEPKFPGFDPTEPTTKPGDIFNPPPPPDIADQPGIQIVTPPIPRIPPWLSGEIPPVSVPPLFGQLPVDIFPGQGPKNEPPGGYGQFPITTPVGDGDIGVGVNHNGVKVTGQLIGIVDPSLVWFRTYVQVPPNEPPQFGGDFGGGGDNWGAGGSGRYIDPNHWNADFWFWYYRELPNGFVFIGGNGGIGSEPGRGVHYGADISVGIVR